MSDIVKTKWNGFRISYLDSGSDWLSVFKKLFPKLDLPQEQNEWKLLQKSASRPAIELRETWCVPVENIGSGAVILKSEKIFRRWNFDRWIRGLFVNMFDLQKRVEKARDSGFTFPMRIFLVAERRKLGFLRKRISICEFIRGNAFVEKKREREVLAQVIRAHSFGICWGGDPDPYGGNIMTDECGNLRGIDLCVKRASWLERGKDLNFFREMGVPLPRFFPNVAAVRAQARIKNFNTHKNG